MFTSSLAKYFRFNPGSGVDWNKMLIKSNDSLPGNFFELILKLLCKNNEQLFIWFHHGRNSIIVAFKHIQFLRYELHLVILIFTFSHSVAEYGRYFINRFKHCKTRLVFIVQETHLKHFGNYHRIRLSKLHYNHTSLYY